MRRAATILRRLGALGACVVVVLCLSVVAAAPAAATGPAHYYSNGLGEGARIKAGERVPTILWARFR